jgi:hypothetical protein
MAMMVTKRTPTGAPRVSNHAFAASMTTATARLRAMRLAGLTAQV